MEHLQAVFDHTRVGVVGSTAIGSTGEAGAGDVVVERQVHRGLCVDTDRMRQLVGALSLRAGSREAVEDVAAQQARAEYRVGDDLDDRVVGYEITEGDAFRNLDPERGPRFDLRPQQLAARDVRNAETGGESLTLGSLAGTRSAEQDDSHGA